MVDSINLFQDGNGIFGGFSGFLNRSALGRGEDNGRPLSGLLNRGSGGLQSNLLQLQSNPLLQQVQNQKDAEKADDDKKDKVTLSDFVKEAADEAVETAQKTPGATSQVFVSEDGRFEVSVDLQVRGDGSFDLDLAVGFAQSSAAALESNGQQQALQDQSLQAKSDAPEDGAENAVANPAEFPVGEFGSSASLLAERFTSYEQSLTTRDLQVNIFFEESKSVALETQQKFGGEAADQFSSVAGQVSNEFKLNINISGDDINNFNQAAADLLQFDESGTLSGFLGAASNVLNSNPNDIGGFIDATRALVGATQEHVSTKLNGFFNGLSSEFGSQLEELGFAPDYLETLGQDVENDLNSFFAITNNFLGSLTGADRIEDQDDIEEQEISILKESLERLEEARQENRERSGLEFFKPSEFYEESDDVEGGTRQTIEELIAALRAEDEQRDQEVENQPVDGDLLSV